MRRRGPSGKSQSVGCDAGSRVSSPSRCACAIPAGLPPQPGFIAKFAWLAALLAPDPVPAAAWMLLALLSLSGLATLIAMGRTGIRIFWATQERAVPRVRAIEMAPVDALLLLCLALTL